MNRYRLFLGFFALVFLCYSSQAKAMPGIDTVTVCDSLQDPDSLTSFIILNDTGITKFVAVDSIKPLSFKAKKRIAAILAFPVPFGLLGLHRLLLGTKPYIPFVYMGTIGGCFLVLPLIDFIAILSANEETFRRYESNPKVFMWSR